MLVNELDQMCLTVPESTHEKTVPIQLDTSIPNHLIALALAISAPRLCRHSCRVTLARSTLQFRGSKGDTSGMHIGIGIVCAPSRVLPWSFVLQGFVWRHCPSESGPDGAGCYTQGEDDVGPLP